MNIHINFLDRIYLSRFPMKTIIPILSLLFLFASCQSEPDFSFEFVAFQPDETGGPNISIDSGSLTFSYNHPDLGSSSILFPIEIEEQQENIYLISWSHADSIKLFDFLQVNNLDTERYALGALLLGTSEPDYAPYPYLRKVTPLSTGPNEALILFKGKRK